MNLIELQRSLRQLRLGGMAAVLETRIHQVHAEARAPSALPPRLNRSRPGTVGRMRPAPPLAER